MFLILPSHDFSPQRSGLQTEEVLMIRFDFDFDVVSDPRPVKPPPRPEGREGGTPGAEGPSPEGPRPPVEPPPSAVEG